MSAQLIQLRDTIAALIEAERVSGTTTFPYTAFTVETSHGPRSKVTDAATQAGKCFVVGRNHKDDTDRRSRGPSATCTRVVLVDIGFQRSNLLISNKAELDKMVDLMEKIRDVVRKGAYETLLPSFLPFWIENTSFKDDDGLPFYYYMAREANVFETYFSANFQITLS